MQDTGLMPPKTPRGNRWRRGAAIGAGCTIIVIALFAIFHARLMPGPLMQRNEYAAPASALPGRGIDSMAMSILPPQLARSAQTSAASAAKQTAAISSPAPMVARAVSLTIKVKDVPEARAELERILSRYQGYAAEMWINTPGNAARSFSASLRVPSPALNAALDDLRRLGRVQNESQSGEEVTQQHTDLVARLKNARETEQRLLAILQQRTGKVEEVLQVEQQISNTRGSIERMEAEQKALEHRVDFATVQLQLAEDFRAQLNPPSATVGARVHNAFVAGIGNAGSTMLGILLFFEEYGPVLLVWLLVLGTPAWLVWRRVRRSELKI